MYLSSWSDTKQKVRNSLLIIYLCNLKFKCLYVHARDFIVFHQSLIIINPYINQANAWFLKIVSVLLLITGGVNALHMISYKQGLQLSSGSYSHYQ